MNRISLRAKLRLSASQFAFLASCQQVDARLADGICFAASYPLHPSVPNPIRPEWGLG